MQAVVGVCDDGHRLDHRLDLRHSKGSTLMSSPGKVYVIGTQVPLLSLLVSSATIKGKGSTMAILIHEIPENSDLMTWETGGPLASVNLVHIGTRGVKITGRLDGDGSAWHSVWVV